MSSATSTPATTAAVAYIANGERVDGFLAALRASTNANRDMALNLLPEVLGADTLEDATERQSIFVKALRTAFKAGLTKAVREALFGKGRSEAKNKADYGLRNFTPDVAAAWSAYNMISKRAGQFAIIRDAAYGENGENVVVQVAAFIDSKGKAPTYAALVEFCTPTKAPKSGGNGGGEGNETDPDGEPKGNEFTLDKFVTGLDGLLGGAEKAGFIEEALAKMLAVAKERARLAKLAAKGTK